MTALPAPQWIDTTAALRELAGELSNYPRLAVDTESNSLHAYREQLCLIQFSTPRTDYLVDPLALDDLSPLAPIFSNPKIEKVFHAAEYDLICLKRDSGITVANLFDTMQAARILGYKQVGLDTMLAEKGSILLDKRYQKADWARRPLTSEMLNYARLDTHYLLDLRDWLNIELEQRGRWALACEEFTRLAAGNGNGKAETPAWQHVKGTQKLTDRQLTILQELCAWRKSKAQRMDRPVFKVIDDRRLVAVARGAPTKADELKELGLTARQVSLFGSDILRAVKRGREAILVRRPHAIRPKQALIDRLNALSDWRKVAAQEIGVESDIVLPKVWMHAIAEQNPKDMGELAALMPHSPWRLENYGAEILKAIGKGESTSMEISNAHSL
jgi:ribonuclease D